MSWIEKINTNLVITTGDGKTFSPNVLNAQKSIEYNVSIFDFKNIDGSLVKRGTPKGTKYDVEFYFQGDNHLDVSRSFENSSKDVRPWTIAHPLYDNILVQPIGFKIDNSVLSYTKYTGSVVETITETIANLKVSAPYKIALDKDAADLLLNQAYTLDVPTPKVNDIKAMAGAAKAAYENVKDTIRNTTDLANYYNVYNEVNAAVGNASNDVGNAVTVMQKMYSLPVDFAEDVQTRLAMLKNMFIALGTPTVDMAKSIKKLFEANGGTLISSMAAATVTRYADSYPNREAVLSVITTIISAHDSYITNLQSVQSLNNGSKTSYIPNQAGINALAQLVGYTVNALLTVAAGSRQERSILLPEDSNIILVAKKYAGLKPDDSTIQELIKMNAIGLNELLIIRKGRKITYYV